MLPPSFETHPDRYRHLRLSVDGPIARLALAVDEDGGLCEGYQLKLNSYDLAVDLELADAVQRLRFEHPQVRCVVLTSALDGVFSAGANIFMLGSSSHAFKVNFCKFTNETRLALEDAARHSHQRYLAAVNGVCSGGGYELALACDEIVLVDDRRSAVALPEVPYLGVLPGTGGLTRVTDKRRVRRDRADLFCTLAEGMKGRRAVEWGLVDHAVPSSRFAAFVAERARALAAEADAGGGCAHPRGVPPLPDDAPGSSPGQALTGALPTAGVPLGPLDPQVDEQGVAYRYVTLRLGPAPRTARLEIAGPPAEAAVLPDDPATRGADWYAVRCGRELDDALLRLRFHYPQVGLVLITTRGDPAAVLALDAALAARADHWFVREALLLQKRVLKRLDLTAKTFFALIRPESCFAGSLLELALAADRAYMLDAEGLTVALSELNFGVFPMSNGLTRLATRFLGDPARVAALAARRAPHDARAAEEAGLVTAAFDALDWDDDVRLAIEERASLSPDACTGMEANLRFAGPETMETKIFGRLSAWQNWIFQRPNAVGPKGALTRYGRPERAEFDYART